MRFLLTQTSHDAADREELASAVVRQLPTTVLFQLVTAATPQQNLTTYVLMFPGEARDNTGIKDLNDNVLGYSLNNEYVRLRQEAIGAIFHPDFFVVGQDYKTALFVSTQKPREEFDRRLVQLDAKLREILLELLKRSKKEGAKKLAAVLQKDKKYRFDMFYGLVTRAAGTGASDATVTTFLLLTEALKGAGIARYIAKGASLKIRTARQFASNASPDKRFDSRGKLFDVSGFRVAAGTAPQIKTFVMLPARDHDLLLEYNDIWVDTVWTKAFFRLSNRANPDVANPDVVRDVRKKKLERPPYPNVKYTVGAQRELLELWIVVLNMIDFIKNFLAAEFPADVATHHTTAARIFTQLRDAAQPVNVRATAEFLSRDIRSRELAVLGTASEYQFFSRASDHGARIMFNMDARDLGVEAIALYDDSNLRIRDRRLSDRPLLEETFASADTISEMRRFTYDYAVQVMGRYHALLLRGGRLGRSDGRKESAKAFRKAFDTPGTFEDDVQIMLGGDELFICAHPHFAAYVHNIVQELSSTLIRDPHPAVGAPAKRLLSLRCGVAFSLAQGADTRESRQLAHDQAMKLADESQGILKQLERQNRRIERLIEMLERNPKKKADAPALAKRLAELRLTQLFARSNHGSPRVLKRAAFDRIRLALQDGTLPSPQELIVELVDFTGTVVDARKLRSDADLLEAAVRNKVGKDNVHVDMPPARK